MNARRRFVISALTMTLAAGTSAVSGQSFTFPLAGSQMVPRVSTDASGSCVAILFSETEEDGEGVFDLKLLLDCTGSFEATAGHIHRGAPGQNGPRLATFDDDPDAGQVSGIWEDLSGQDFFDLITGRLYVRLPSEAVPRGEVRGQITGLRLPSSIRRLRFSLSGSQEVPPVDTPASGSCLAAFVPGEDDLVLFCSHDVENPTVAHIHQGAAGENGPVVLDLSVAENVAGLFIFEAAPADFFDRLAAGTLYVGIHSEEHPGGEIRGQITGCFAGLETLCLNDDRFEVKVRWQDFQGGSGTGVAVPQTADSGLFWFFGPDNTELMIKVLDACGDPFNHFWVFLAATTNVGFTVTVTDTVSGEIREYTNNLGMTAETVLDTQAFATCP